MSRRPLPWKAAQRLGRVDDSTHESIVGRSLAQARGDLAAAVRLWAPLPNNSKLSLMRRKPGGAD